MLPTTARTGLIVVIFILFSKTICAQATCSGASTLTVGTTCSPTSGNLKNAANAAPTGGCGGASAYGIWYKFQATNTTATITVSSLGSTLTNTTTYVELLTGTCLTSFTSTCQNVATSLNVSGLTIGVTYYIRVYVTTNPNNSGNPNQYDFSICVVSPPAPVVVTAGRMKEVYKQTILSAAGALQYPWEVTYGPDNKLWITESRGYKVYRMDPSTGTKTTVLDLNTSSTDLSAWGADSLNVQFSSAQNPWPQGGLAGLAIHPQFMDGSGHDYVYVSYVHRYLYTAASSGGIFFRNKIVRFTYNSGTGKLGSPSVVCDTIPGGQDHNSQRMIIAPVTPGGTNYLFYAAGDMGSGQYSNRMRPQNAQNVDSYEGKILRFNLEPIAGSWIPTDNPYSSTSAVYSIGIRNNQGFAYDTLTNKLYGSSHGPFSDDEINIIESGKNYGHPLVVGFAADGNVNGTTAGNAPGMSGGSTSTCPLIVSESDNATTIGASYKDPLFSGYVNSPDYPSISTLWNTTTGGNALWPTETWSGLDIYSNKLVPGWKRSLVAASLKWGRLMRLKLGGAGTTTFPNNNVNDTISYFNSGNRFRDLAFSPDGKDIFVIMDNNSATSGPGQDNPVVTQCAGCVQKYTFLGYADASGKSSIPTSIDVTDGTVNSVNAGTTITIDDNNNNYWVPITGPDGNIMAEIYPNGNNLGTVTSAFYKNSGAIRIKNNTRYLDRNITITPQTQPSTPVKIRLYISKAEFDALDYDANSMVSAITDLKILKNSDACRSDISAATTLITPTYEEAHGANGYMLQATISGFSSFYFSSSDISLPLDLLTFSGSLINNSSVLLKWKTENEINVSNFLVERSTNGNNFNTIGTVSANGNNNPGSVFNYSFTDIDAVKQQSLILYYRLKIVDRDGSFKYSNIITISLNDITGKLNVSPNPTVNEVKVNISAPVDGRIEWKLFDNTGRVIRQNAEHVRKGNGNSFTINMSKLAIGTYYLSVSGAGFDEKIKLQKM